MGLEDQGPYGFKGPLSPLDVIPPTQCVEVYETATFEEGEGLRIMLAGGFVRVDGRVDGVELTAWCGIERFLEALIEQTHAIGS